MGSSNTSGSPPVVFIQDDTFELNNNSKMDTPMPATTRNQILGFYAYAIAYLPYTLASSNFLPLMINGLARKVGSVLLRDAAGVVVQPEQWVPCPYADVATECYLPILGSWLPTKTFSLYANALGVAIQAAGLIMFSALADRDCWRSRFLLVLTLLGGLAGSFYACFFTPGTRPEEFASGPSLVILLTGLSVVANCCAGMGSAYYFSYLPVLARYHPKVLEAEAAPNSEDEVSSVRDTVINKLSSESLALGLLSASTVLFVGVLITRNPAFSSGNYSQQLSVSIAGAWWFVLGGLSWYFLPKTPGPSLPAGRNPFTHSLIQLKNSLREVGSNWSIWLGLLSWFFLSDGLNTLLSVTMFVGDKQLKVTPSESILLSAIAPIAEAIGIMVLNTTKRKGPRATKLMTIALSLSCIMMTVVGLLHYYHPELSLLGTKMQYFTFFVAVVTVYACLQSFHRSLFSHLVPKGRESEFFGLYLICYRGTSWIGNLAVGAIAQASNGDTMLGFWFVLALFVLGTIPLFPMRYSLEGGNH